MTTCGICGQNHFNWDIQPHTCPPKWWCWHDDGDDGYYETDDGGTPIFADDAESAATKYCNEYQEHEGDEQVTVVVKSVLTGAWCKVDVYVHWEWIHSYRDPTPFTPKSCRVVSLRPPEETS